MSQIGCSTDSSNSLFLRNKFRHRLSQQRLLSQSLPANTHSSWCYDENLLTTSNELSGLKGGKTIKVIFQVIKNVYSRWAVTNNVAVIVFTVTVLKLLRKSRHAIVKNYSELTCSTISAIRDKLGKPSGVETTLVPALITILFAMARSSRPLIMFIVSAAQVTSVVKIWEKYQLFGIKQREQQNWSAKAPRFCANASILQCVASRLYRQWKIYQSLLPAVVWSRKPFTVEINNCTVSYCTYRKTKVCVIL